MGLIVEFGGHQFSAHVGIFFEDCMYTAGTLPILVA